MEKSIQISSDGAIITIEQNVSDYLIHYMTKENSSVFTAPISTELDLTYQNGLQINFRNVTLIAGDGNVTLSPILQNFLKPINSPELMQDCFEFSLERLILKIFVGGISFLVILSNGVDKIRNNHLWAFAQGKQNLIKSMNIVGEGSSCLSV